MLITNLNPAHTLAASASSLGQPLGAVVIAALDAMRPGIEKQFNLRMQAWAPWLRLLEASPRGYAPGEIVSPAPLLLPESTTFPEANIEDPVALPTVTHSIGFVATPSLETAASYTPEQLSNLAEDIGDHIADGIEEHVLGTIEGLVWVAGQTEGTALNVANLAGALVKLAALTTADGGPAPAAGALLVSDDLIPTVASLWPGPNNLPYRVTSSRLLPTGRWYLFPKRAPFRLMSTGLPWLDISDRFDATARIRITATTMVSEDIDFRKASDGVTPRWSIKGGA